MNFTHKENEIILFSQEGSLLARITFPYIGEDKNVVEINHTFVDTSLRGQGIAGKLMNAVIDELGKQKSESRSHLFLCSRMV